MNVLLKLPGSLLLNHAVWRLQVSSQVCIQQCSAEDRSEVPTAQATEWAGTTTE